MYYCVIVAFCQNVLNEHAMLCLFWIVLYSLLTENSLCEHAHISISVKMTTSLSKSKWLRVRVDVRWVKSLFPGKWLGRRGHRNTQRKHPVNCIYLQLHSVYNVLVVMILVTVMLIVYKFGRLQVKTANCCICVQKVTTKALTVISVSLVVLGVVLNDTDDTNNAQERGRQ